MTLLSYKQDTFTGCYVAEAHSWVGAWNLENDQQPARQAGRRLDSALSPNVVAMATMVGPQHLACFHWIGHPRKPPGRCKHLLSICHTSRLIGDFVHILGSKFWALWGLNQKSAENSFVECHMENWRLKKWFDSIEKQRTRSNLKERVTDRQTDRRTDRQSQRQKIIDS